MSAFSLSLMMGGFTASPVPQAVIDALKEVQVTTPVGSQSGFQLKFTWSPQSPLARLQKTGFFDPRQRVIISVMVNGKTEVLMDGIITKQDLTPDNAAGKAAFTVTGLDLTALMDFIDFTGIPYPALPNFLIVEAILAKYAVLGVMPVAIPDAIPAIRNPLDSFIKHKGTDLEEIRRLASGSGTVFFLDPGPTPGRSLAYWGPDITKLFAGVQPSIDINFGAATNLETINFSYDGTLATDYIVTLIEPNSKVPIPLPVPSIGMIRAAITGSPAPSPLKLRQLQLGAGKSLADSAMEVLGKLIETADVVTGSGSLDVLKYGQVFKARQLALVRGAGDYYNGKYYVKSVTHDIKAGSYKQNFSLARSGPGA
jgi:hypothetical protein